MYYVYILKSQNQDWNYVGSSGNLKERFRDHNSGKVQSTKHYAPFDLKAYVAVGSEQEARELEQYFKTGSGRAWLSKRIL